MILRGVVARNVRSLRERAGLSQEELAHVARLHTTYLSGIENGRRNPTLDVIERMASALDVEASALLARESTDAT
nr:helix-turn-helix transcriptional regulator [uncultured Brevundimonas sp.]